MPFDPNAAATGDGVFGLPQTPAQAGVVLVPVPFEATTSYGSGAAHGPRAILAASRQVDLFDLVVDRPYAAGLHLLDADPRVAAWNAEARALALPVIARGGDVGGDAVLRAGRERVNALSAELTGWCGVRWARFSTTTGCRR